MYKAFISYSHAADEGVASALQSALERFAKPWFKIRQFNVFRDETNLSVNPYLWKNIQAALDKSEYFIYLASPSSAVSHWVQLEVDYWLANKPVEKLVIVLTDGELSWDNRQASVNLVTDCLTESLKIFFTAEPFYVDLRNTGRGGKFSLLNGVFKKEIVKLAATLHGKEPKEMESEELSEHRKMTRLRSGLILVLLLLLFISIGATWIARKKNAEAIEQFKIAVKEKVNAQQQEKIANEEKIKAQLERSNAQKQEKIAITNAEAATRQKQIADSERNVANNQRDIAQSNFLISEAKTATEYNPTLGIRLAEASMIKHQDSINKYAEYKIYREHSFNKVLANPLEYTTCMGFSTDNKFMVTGSARGLVRILNSDGSVITQHECQLESIDAIAISKTGNYVVIISGNSVQLCDRKWKFKEIFNHDFNWHGVNAINSIAFSPDEGSIIFGCPDAQAILYQMKNGKVRYLKGHLKPIVAAIFNASGSLMVTGSFDSTAIIWDTMGTTRRHMTYPGKVSSISFSPDGNYILAGLSNGQSILSDTNGRRIKVFQDDCDFVSYTRFSPSGNTVFIASNYNWPGGLSNKCSLYHLNGQLIQQFSYDAHLVIATTAAFSPDEQFVTIHYRDYTLRRWLIKPTIRKEIRFTTDYSVSAELSPDGTKILAAFENNAILYDADGNELRKFVGHKGTITAINFSSSGKYIIAVSDSVANVWQLDKEDPIKTIMTKSFISRACFSPNDSAVLLSFIYNYPSELWTLNEKKEPVIIGISSQLFSMFHSDNKNILVAYPNATALYDINGKFLKYFLSGMRHLDFVAYSHDSKFVIARELNGSPMLYSTGSGKRIKLFDDEMMRGASSISFGRNSESFLIGSYTNSFFLMDYNGFLLGQFIYDGDVITKVQGSRDGKTILTSSFKSIKLWSTPALLKYLLKNDKIDSLSTEQKERYGIDKHQ